MDSDPLQLGKFHPVAVPVWGDAAVTARLLLDGVPADPGTEDQTAQLRERWAIWRAERRRARWTTAATASPPRRSSQP